MPSGILMGLFGKPKSDDEGDEGLDFDSGLADAMEDLAEALAKVRELGYKPEGERSEVDNAAMSAACKLAAKAFKNAFEICESEPHEEKDAE